MEKTLKKYSEIKIMIADLEEKRKVLEEEVVKHIKKSVKVEDGKRKIETDYGKFVLYTKVTSWKYTEAVDKIEEKLKIAKYTEQEKGIAKPIEKEVLSFNSPKIETN